MDEFKRASLGVGRVKSDLMCICVCDNELMLCKRVEQEFQKTLQLRQRMRRVQLGRDLRKMMGRESTEVEKVENEVGMVENEVGGEEEARRRRVGRRTRRVHNVEPQAELALASTAGKPEKIIFNFFFFFHFHYVEQRATLKSMIMFTQLIALDLATALSCNQYFIT